MFRRVRIFCFLNCMSFRSGFRLLRNITRAYRIPACISIALITYAALLAVSQHGTLSSLRGAFGNEQMELFSYVLMTANGGHTYFDFLVFSVVLFKTSSVSC